MKTSIVMLPVVILAGVGIQAADPPPAVPGWKSGEIDPPVYSSPTNDRPTSKQFTNLITVPAISNWPVTNLPPMTNWTATNRLPAMTNPPPLPPPDGI